MIGYWISFALLFPYIFFSVICFNKWSKRFVKEEITPEMEKEANKRTTRYILFYWLCNLFYMACFIDNLVCKYIFGGLIMLIIFMNLAKTFSIPKERNGFERWSMLQDFCVGIGLTIYLIYIIPDNDIKEVVIPVLAAVYGGLITLAGVSLTIRKSDINRKEDEIKKAKPLLFVIDPRTIKEQDITSTKYLISDNNIGTLERADNNEKSYIIQEIILYNSDYSHATLIGFRINEDYHCYDFGQVIPKNTCYRLFNNFRFRQSSEIKLLSLVIKDMLDNIYELEVCFEIQTKCDNNIIIITGSKGLRFASIYFEVAEEN
ncbi:MAG: hypothetical protein J6Y28_00090 [Acholeplasmatales bacterium]|nr:hypothetical protein [Acholeplasmatales bacterium]